MEYDRSHSFTIGLVSFALSAAINGTVFFSFEKILLLDSTYIRLNREAEHKKKEPMQLEFVEAPPRQLFEKPKNARKMAAFDALNQDAMADKSKAQESPYIKTKGPSDQLEQKRGGPTSEPAPEAKPVQASHAVSPQAQEQEKQKDAGTGEEIIIPRSPQNKTASASNEALPQVASKPKPKIAGLSGNDRITTQAMTKTLSPGARAFGITSFEAAGSGMGEFMKRLKEKVWLSWFPYLAFQYPSDFRGSDAVIGFTLDSHGEVKIVRVLESHGSEVFAAYCMEAIQKASSFGELPKEILALTGKDEIEIKFGFHYG